MAINLGYLSHIKQTGPILRSHPNFLDSTMSTASQLFKLVQLADLATIRRFVTETAVSAHADAETVDDLVLAMNEAVTNIIRHGYGPQSGDVEVLVEVGAGCLSVWLYDDAPPFDPSQAPTPDISRPLAERPFGGMGIHMMRAFTDEVHYQRTPNGRNCLLLKKSWPIKANHH
jgi:serine/threonine-protein kinase RsbW